MAKPTLDASFNPEELEAPAPAPAPPNPFDPEQLRLSQDFTANVGVEKVLLTIPVRKPDRQKFIRVRSGEEWRLAVGMVELKEEREIYVVRPDVARQLTDDIMSNRLLVTCTDRQGSLFLWPLRLPSDGRQNKWTDTALDCAKLAERQWVRVVADMGGGAYTAYVATSDSLPEPEWPNKSFGELLELAFKKHIIDSLDHAVIRQLLGAA